MNLVGMALGALGVSPVADQWGRRPAILSSLVFMSVGMALCGHVGRVLFDGGGPDRHRDRDRRDDQHRGHAGARICAFQAPRIRLQLRRLGLSGGNDHRRLCGGDGAGRLRLARDLLGRLGPVAGAVPDSLVLYLAESLDYLLARQPKNAIPRTNKMLRRMDIPEITALPPKPEGTRDAVLAEIFQRVPCARAGQIVPRPCAQHVHLVLHHQLGPAAGFADGGGRQGRRALFELGFLWRYRRRADGRLSLRRVGGQADDVDRRC